MKVKKIVIAAFIAVMVAAVAAGLFAYISYVKQSENLMDITLYFFNPSTSTVTAEKRSVTKTDDKNSLVSYVEKAYKGGPKSPNLIKALPDGMGFDITNNDSALGNVLCLELPEKFKELNGKERMIAVGSLVYTFSDLPFIDNVDISVDGESLAKLYDVSVQGTSLSRENVVNNPAINPEKINRQEVTLYFLNGEGVKLVPEQRNIEVKQSQTLEYQIVQQLVGGPEDEDLRAAIPKNTEVKDIKTEEGICYVNLSASFVDNLSGNANDEKLVIYSIVNSLTELNTVNKVQFLIDGEKVSEFKGHYDFSKTFERDESLIGK